MAIACLRTSYPRQEGSRLILAISEEDAAVVDTYLVI